MRQGILGSLVCWPLSTKTVSEDMNCLRPGGKEAAGSAGGGEVPKVTSLWLSASMLEFSPRELGGLTLCDWVFWRGRLSLLSVLKHQTAVQSTVSDHGAFGWGSEGDAAWGLITRLFLIIRWFIQQHLRPEISDWLWCYHVCRECAQLCIFMYPWVADCLFLQSLQVSQDCLDMETWLVEDLS